MKSRCWSVNSAKKGEEGGEEEISRAAKVFNKGGCAFKRWGKKDGCNFLKRYNRALQIPFFSFRDCSLIGKVVPPETSSLSFLPSPTLIIFFLITTARCYCRRLKRWPPPISRERKKFHQREIERSWGGVEISTFNKAEMSTGDGKRSRFSRSRFCSATARGSSRQSERNPCEKDPSSASVN